MFYEVLMEKRAGVGDRARSAGLRALNQITHNPYRTFGVIGGAAGGAALADEGERGKGALRGAVAGGIAGHLTQSLLRNRGTRMIVDPFITDAYGAKEHRDFVRAQLAKGAPVRDYVSPKRLLMYNPQTIGIGTTIGSLAGLAASPRSKRDKG